MFPFGGNITAQESVSLNQCYEWAQANYPQIRQYDLIRQTEQYTLAGLAKGWLPQPVVNAKATYQNEVTQLPFNSKELSVIMPGIQIPVLSKDQYQVTGEVSQQIWDGGIIRSGRHITRAQAELERRQLENELYVINSRINDLYFGCLLQDERLKQNELLQQNLVLNTDRVRALMAGGMANESDLNNLEAELLSARQQEIEIKSARTAFLTMLQTFTGQDLSKDVVLEEPLVPDKTLSPVINRPELAVLDAQALLIEEQNKQTTAGLMPRLGAFIQGGYGRPGLDMLSDSFSPFYIAGIRLSWNPGKFYTLRSDRRKTETNRKKVEVSRETFLFNTQLQLIQQNEEIRKWKVLQQSDNEIIRLRTSVKQAAEVKLENGVISILDLIREINAEHQARLTAATHKVMQLQAIYNYMYTTNEHP